MPGVLVASLDLAKTKKGEFFYKVRCGCGIKQITYGVMIPQRANTAVLGVCHVCKQKETFVEVKLIDAKT